MFDVNGTWVHLQPAFITIGIWRPTGERTAEGVEFYEFPNGFERLFDLSSPVPEDVLELAPIKNRFDAAIDATGNAFETVGLVVDEEGNDGPRYASRRSGVRMAPVLDATATPAT